MLINTLNIKDIRKFESFSCDFKPGLNIVLGENFAGKTTICEAIFYCLFGESLKGKASVKSLPRYNSVSPEISLTLIREQDNIQITRRIPSDTAVTVLSQGQSRTLTSETAVNNFLKEVYRRNENALRFSFLSESEVVEFISLSKSDKRDLLYSIAGIDTLEKIRDIFIENRKQSKRDEKSVQMEAAALESQLSYSAEELFTEARKRKDELQKEYERMLDIAVSAANTDDGSSIKADLDSLIKDRDEKRRELANKLGEFKNLESFDEYLQKLNEKEKELVEKTREFDELDQRVKNGKAFIVQTDAHLDELNKVRKDASNPNCPLCLQPLANDTLSRVISINLTKKCKADELLIELQERLNKLKMEIEQCKAVLSKKPDILVRRDIARILSLDIEKIDESIRSKEKLLEASEIKQTAAAGVQTSAEQSVTGHQTEGTEKNLNSLKAALDIATKEYERLLVQKTVHDQNAEKYIICQNKLEAAKKIRAVCEAAVAATEKCLERVIHEIFVTAGDSITAFINDLGVLPGYQVNLSVEDYMPVVYKSDKKIDINSLSGSEKSLIYIGLKLAVAAAFQNQFLVLDDPTIYLDPSRQRSFIKSMYTLSQTGKQIILMTSNPALVIDEANLIRI